MLPIVRFFATLFWTAAIVAPVYAWSPWPAWAQIATAAALAIPSILLMQTVWDVCVLTYRHGEPVNWPKHQSRGTLKDWKQRR